MTFPDYGDEYIYSANVKIADIVLALKWIQKNANSFGGSKDNITLFGQRGATETVGVRFNSKEVSKKVTEYTLAKLHITDVKKMKRSSTLNY